MRIILASKSPRRRELLSAVTDNFEIITREVDESLAPEIHPKCGVELLAIRKGAAVADEVGADCLVISSDTLVELDGAPLGKPSDEGDAASILRSLSGRAHNVHTGIAVHYRGRVYSGVDSSTVYFKALDEGEILEYVASGEPMDKAGAYGIQGLGGRFVTHYDGNFDTIVGLSVSLTQVLIERAIKENDS